MRRWTTPTLAASPACSMSSRAGTQFLVITHNPRTMQSADAVYGVTMQEPGVSTIVGVRLGERERAERSLESKVQGLITRNLLSCFQASPGWHTTCIIRLQTWTLDLTSTSRTGP